MIPKSAFFILVMPFIKIVQSGYWKMFRWVLFSLLKFCTEWGAGRRAKKLSFQATLDQICVFILANHPHHHPQIIYTDPHIASDSSQTPGCYFGPLAA